MRNRRGLGGWLFVIVLSLAAALVALPAAAATMSINYQYDTTNFFGAGNPQGATGGAKAKAAIEAAASFLSTIVGDTLVGISTPSPYQVSTGSVTWQWKMKFNHPATGSEVELTNPTIPANQIRVFVGARSLPGNAIGQGGPGGYSWNVNSTGTFTTPQINTINQITSNFQSAVEWRGMHKKEKDEFGPWGGVISFNNGGPWHFDHTTLPTGNQRDFYSVALHELVHVLGFGTSPQWHSLVNSNTSRFGGSAAMSMYGGPVPVWRHDDEEPFGHWNDSVNSTIYGTNTPQATALRATHIAGARTRLTHLDAAALSDVGWNMLSLPSVPGDFNGDAFVDAADYTRWRDMGGTTQQFNTWKNNFGRKQVGLAAAASVVPEPSSAILLVVTALVFAGHRRR